MKKLMERFNWNRQILLIFLTVIFWQFGFGIYRAVFANFAAQELGVEAGQYGLLEGIREVPGLLTMAFMGVAAVLPPSILAGVCILVTATGLALFSVAHNFLHLVLFTIVFSTGFHLLMPVQRSLVLGYSSEGVKGRRLGEMGSLTAFAVLLAMGVVAVSSSVVGIRTFFILGAIIAAAGTYFMFTLSRDEEVEVEHRSFVVKRKYVPYYLLSLLSGARRHMFLTFAVFNLVKVHDVPVGTIALPMGISNGLSIFGRPIIGNMIDTFGERRVLVVGYLVVALIVLGYGFVPWVPVLFVLFCLDGLFRFQFALTTFLDKIAPTEEVQASLATGQTVNHIAGVAVPIAGGVIWEVLGPKITFLGGAALAIIAMLHAYSLKEMLEEPAEEGVSTG